MNVIFSALFNSNKYRCIFSFLFHVKSAVMYLYDYYLSNENKLLSGNCHQWLLITLNKTHVTFPFWHFESWFNKDQLSWLLLWHWPVLSRPLWLSWRSLVSSPATPSARSRWRLTLGSPDWRCKPSDLLTPTGCSANNKVNQYTQQP